MNSRNVLTKSLPPSENRCRDAFAVGLHAVQGSRTDLDTADALGWSVGTIRNVRNRTHSISAKCLTDAAYRTDGAFLAPWLAMLGLNAQAIEHAHPEALDVASQLAECSAVLLAAMSPTSPGGHTLTQDELHAVANAARKLLPTLTAIVAKADGLKVAA